MPNALGHALKLTSGQSFEYMKLESSCESDSIDDTLTSFCILQNRSICGSFRVIAITGTSTRVSPRDRLRDIAVTPKNPPQRQMDGPYSNSRGQSFDYTAENGYSRVQTQRRGFRGTEENAKTKLCMRWLAGDCRFGPRCNFAHGSHELRKIPPKPGRFSHDTREREIEKERQLAGYPPYGGFHSLSFDAAYRHSAPHSSVYSDNYLGGNPFSRGPGNYPSPVMGPPSMNGARYSGSGGPSVGLVQHSGPIHISAPSQGANGGSAGEYYSPDVDFPQVGPNGWTMYRDSESGKPYYHNHSSGITQWKCPDEWPMH